MDKRQLTKLELSDITFLMRAVAANPNKKTIKAYKKYKFLKNTNYLHKKIIKIICSCVGNTEVEFLHNLKELKNKGDTTEVYVAEHLTYYYEAKQNGR